MNWSQDATSAVAQGLFEANTLEAKVQDLTTTNQQQANAIATLKQDLAACQDGTPPDPPPSDGGVRYEITDFSNPIPHMSIMGGSNEDASKGNTTVGPGGVLVLRCDGKQGAAVMFKMPFQYGYWEVECRFMEQVKSPSTKICLLLWPDGGGWGQTHHEIDFNESAMREESHQSIHDENTAGVHVMRQTKYPANQYEKHVYGVRLGERIDGVPFVEYFLDGFKFNHIEASQGTFVPKDNWNLHIRTIPKGSTDKTTLVVTRVKATE